MAMNATKTKKQPDTVDKIRALKAPRTKQAARVILDTRFTTREDERVRLLLERNGDGRITPQEKAELHEYIEAGDRLTMLWAQSRILLDRC